MRFSPLSAPRQPTRVRIPVERGGLTLSPALLEKLLNPTAQPTAAQDENLILTILRQGKLPRAVFARTESRFPFAYDEVAMETWEKIFVLEKRHHGKCFDLASLLQAELKNRVPAIPSPLVDKWGNNDFYRLRDKAFELSGDNREQKEAFARLARILANDEIYDGEQLKIRWQQQPIVIPYQVSIADENERGDLDVFDCKQEISSKTLRENTVLLAALLDAVTYVAAEQNKLASRRGLVNVLNTLSQYSFWS